MAAIAAPWTTTQISLLLIVAFAQLRVINGQCYSFSGTQYGLSGSVALPSSGYYSNNLYCVMRFTARTGMSLQLRFSRFETESGRDYLLVYSGSTLYGRYEGSYSVPPVIYLPTGVDARLIFRTDGSVSGRGFSFNWIYYTTSQWQCYSFTGIAQGTSGRVDLPPSGDYINNLLCTMRFTGRLDTSLELRFRRFYTEPCCDHLYIYTGNSLYRRYEGATIPSVISLPMGVDVRLEFRTDSSVTRPGLSFNWIYVYKPTCSPSYGPVCPYDCNCGPGACTADSCSVSCKNPHDCVFGDVSRGKTTLQSSTWSSSSASKAIDGTYATDNVGTCAQTQERTTQTQPWWRIDFGSQHAVYGIYLYNRILRSTENEYNRLGHFQIRVGDSYLRPTTGQLFTVNQVCKDYNEFIPERLTIGTKPYAWIECDKPLRGRYLSVQNKDSIARESTYKNVLTICEVDIRGYKVCSVSTKSGKNCDVTGCWCWNHNCGSQNILGYCSDGCMTGRIGKLCMQEVSVPSPSVENIKPTEVNVTWKVPLADGDHIDSYSTVTVGYALQYRMLGDHAWSDNTGEVAKSGSSRSSKITNLDSSKVYEIRVVMTKSALGTRRVAASSGIVSNCAVPQSKNVTVIVGCREENGVQAVQMDITWQADDTHPPCLGSARIFDVEYAEFGAHEFTKLSNATSPVRVQSVKSNGTYVVRVKARYTNPRLSEFYSYSDNNTVTIGPVPVPENFTLVTSPGASINEFNVKAAWKQPIRVCPLVDDITNYLWYRNVGTERDVVVAVPEGQLEFTMKLNSSSNYHLRLEARSPDRASSFTSWIKADKPVIIPPKPAPVAAIAGGVVTVVVILAVAVGVGLGLFYYYRIKSTKPKHTSRYPRVEQPTLNEVSDDTLTTKQDMAPIEFDNIAYIEDNEPQYQTQNGAPGPQFGSAGPQFGGGGSSPPIIACPPPRDPQISPGKIGDLETEDEYTAYLED